MIVRDEEQTIKRCLDCIAFADEWIIIDTGSNDNTKKIIEECAISNGIKKCIIGYFEWCNDFSAARNYAFENATSDYIIWLDADDVIPEESQKMIKAIDWDLWKNHIKADAIYMPYNMGFDSDGHPRLSYYRERIVLRDRKFKWIGQVHECIDIRDANIKHINTPIEHRPIKKDKDPSRNLKIYQELEDSGVEFTPRMLYYYARELKDNGFNIKSITKFQEFLKYESAWVEDKINACICISENYLILNRTEYAFDALLKTFYFDLPRAEVCCRIANIYFSGEDYNKAIYWYRQALKAPTQTNGFICNDYSKFIPHIQLCVCYHEIGELNRAIYHHEHAENIKPNHPAVKINKKYFNSKKT